MSQEETRLNKFIASCGIGSRRTCDKLIQNGLVMVNGAVETNPATRVTSEDFVKLEGKRVQQLEILTILMNKPRGLVCTKNDELDRDTIYSIIPPKFQHLNHVGRLDKESEGLIILTNDGDFAQKLSHPSTKIEKEYIVTTDQAFSNDVLDKFIEGVRTPEGLAKAKSIKRLSPRRVRMVLETGLKRQIREMFMTEHIRVKKLVRIRIGSLEGDGLEIGKIEALEPERLELLFSNPKIRKKTTSQHNSKIKKREERDAPPQKWNKPTAARHKKTGIRTTKRQGKSYKRR